MFAMPNRQMFNPMMGGGYGFNPVAGPGMLRGPGVMPGNIPFMGMGGGYPSIAYRGPMPSYSRSGRPPPMFGDFRGIAGLMAQEAARAAATANNQVGRGFGDMSQAQIAQGDAMRQAQQQAGPQLTTMAPASPTNTADIANQMRMQQQARSAAPQQMIMGPAGGTSTADIANQARMQQQAQRQAMQSGPPQGNPQQQLLAQYQGGNQTFSNPPPVYGPPPGQVGFQDMRYSNQTPLFGQSMAQAAQNPSQNLFGQPSSGGAFASGKSGGGKGGGIGDMMNVGASPQAMNAYAAPMGGFFR